MILRRKSRIVRIGKVKIGAGFPIAIQSMAKTETANVEDTVKQIKELESAGCPIVRLAVKDEEDAHALKKIRAESKAALVADIHFNWRLAIKAIESGVDKIRLNPGNIYKPQEVEKVAQAAKTHHIPIRVGVNSGSLRNSVPGARCQVSGVDKMVKSALDYIRMLEKFGFRDIVISLKASNALDTIEAYSKIAGVCDYPLHLGVTATGPAYSGMIKSSIAIGALLLGGIGDTIRVSLTDAPLAEVKAAKSILEALELQRFGPQIVSCPTCGRCEVDLVKIVNNLENRLSTIDYRLSTRSYKIAVMGCVVNGPGEAKEADLGIAFGKKEGLLFKNGKALRKLDMKHCTDDILKEIRKI